MAEDFDTLFKGYMAQLEGATQSPTNAPFDAEAYLASVGIKPKQTGIIKGAVKSLGRGVGGAISSLGKSLEYDQDQNPDLVNKAGYYIDEAGQYVKNLINAPVAEKDSQRQAFFEAMESAPTSIMYGAPAFIGGAIGGGLAGLAGAPSGPGAVATALGGRAIGAGLGSALTMPMMQQAAAQETYELLKKEHPELSEEVIRDKAAKAGLWEAAPEAATNIAESMLFGSTPLGRGALPFVKALGKNVAKSMPLEMAGEAVTGYGQASNLKSIYPEVEPFKEALHGANVAAYMAPLMAGGGTIIEKLAQEKQPSAEPVRDTKTSTDLINEPKSFVDSLPVVEPTEGTRPLSAEDKAKLYKHLGSINVQDATGNIPVSKMVVIPKSSPIQALAALADKVKGTSFRKAIKDTGDGFTADFNTLMDLNEHIKSTPTLAAMPAAATIDSLVTEAAQEQAVSTMPAVADNITPIDLTEEVGIDNLPQVRPTAGVPGFRRVEGEVLPPVRNEAGIGLTPAIEDAEFTQLAESVRPVPQEQIVGEVQPQLPLLPKQLEAPSDNIITDSGAIIPRSEYNRMVDAAIAGKQVNGLTLTEIKAAKANIKQGKLKPVKSEVKASSGIVVSTKSGPKALRIPEGKTSPIANEKARLVWVDGLKTPTAVSAKQFDIIKQSYPVQTQEAQAVPVTPVAMEDLTDEQIAALPTADYKPSINKQLKELMDDKANQARKASSEREGEAVKPTKPKPAASREAAEASGDVQTHAKEGKTSTEAKVNKPAKETLKVVEFEDTSKPAHRKLIQDRADAYMDLEEAEAAYAKLADEAYSVDKASLEDKIEDLKEKIEDFDDKIRKLQQAASPKAKKGSLQTPLSDKVAESNNTILQMIKDKKSVKDLLDYLASKHTNVIILSLAKQLSNYNINLEISQVNNLTDPLTGEPALGLYEDGKISLDANSFSDTDMGAVFLHEVIHHVVADKLNQKKFAMFKSRLFQLKAEARKTLGKDADKYYGLRETSHIEELIAEVFSDKVLQDALEGIKLKEPKTSYMKTLLDKFVDFIKQVAGLKVEHNMLKEVLAIGSAFVEPVDEAPTVAKTSAKLMDYFTDPKGSFNYDYLKDTVAKQNNTLDGLVKVFENHFPNAHTFFTKMFRNPLWIGEKLLKEGDAGARAFIRAITNREKKTEDYNSNLEEFIGAAKGKPALREIADKVRKLSPRAQFSFWRLVNYSDMMDKKFDSVAEAKAAKMNDVTILRQEDAEEVFKLYNEIDAFGKGLFKQTYKKAMEQALARLDKRVAKKLEHMLKFESFVDEDTDFKSQARNILDQEGLSSELVREALEDVMTAHNALKRMRNTFHERKFYMPRIRKPGPYKLQVFEKNEDGTNGRELYSASFASEAARNNQIEDMKAGLSAMLVGDSLFKKSDKIYVETYTPKQMGVEATGGLNVLASDSFLDDVMAKAARVGDLSEEDIKNVRKAMAQHTAEMLLSMSGSGKHKIKRMEDYVEGFETNPIEAWHTYVQSVANSYAKADYVQNQIYAYNEVKKANPKLSEYLLEYIHSTTKARTSLDEASSKVRYGATLYFMGANLGSAAINLTQNIILGVPTLAQEGVSTKEAASAIYKYYKQVAPQITKESYDRLKILDAQELALASHVQASPKDLNKGMDTILQWYRKSGLNYDTQSALALGTNEEEFTTKLASKFSVFADKLMVPFKAVEVANREATLLAGAEILANKRGIDLNTASEEQLRELYEDSKHLVNKIHFMGSGNLPLYAQKHALMRTALAMQSFGINFFNIIYNSMTSGDKAEYKKLAQVAGMMFMLGGAFGAIPGSDELNKLLKRLLGYDVKLAAKKALGDMTDETFAHVIMHGPFNISSNINLRIPDPFGFVEMLVGGKEAGAFSMGAIGSLAHRFYKAADYASDGQFAKAVGIGSPEAFARAVRAYMEYSEGFTSAKGAPVYFEGKPLRATEGEAFIKALTGFKSNRETGIADVRFSKYELQEQWKNKRSVAVNKFAKGDRQAMLDFNETLRDNDQARMLVKPITGSDRLRVLSKKQDKKSVEFEKEYS